MYFVTPKHTVYVFKPLVFHAHFNAENFSCDSLQRAAGATTSAGVTKAANS